MKNWFPRIEKALLLSLALLVGMPMTGMAQNKKSAKMTPHTRMVMGGRDGKIDFEKGRAEMQRVRKQQKKRANQTIGNIPLMFAADLQESTSVPMAAPVRLKGQDYVECWISLTNQDYHELENLGVKILARFQGKVIANIPVCAMAQVASQKNVTKVSVAKTLDKKTYRSRVMTNVDDVLTLSADAISAGLSQAYDGTGVVLGIIDTGIDFGHSMLSGSRLKKKYVYDEDAASMIEYTGSTYYYTDETHGTHTSTIAGGSSLSYTAYVYTTGTSYSTVSNASFGGMAPGADLVLCDLGESLTDAKIAWSIQTISDYAQSVGKPCVISLSLGGHFGPHDGTGDMADVCKACADRGDIILFSSSNDGQNNLWLGKNASSSSPSQSVLTCSDRSSMGADYSEMLTYSRTPNTELAVRFHVVNTSTNKVLWTSQEITTDNQVVDEEGTFEVYGAEISVNDVGSDGTTKLSTYFTAYNDDSDSYGYLLSYMDKDELNDKWYAINLEYMLVPVNTNYKIAVSVYPRTGTSYVDSWAFNATFTASTATYSGTTFVAGANECSVSDEATYPAVISVGSYCSSKYWRAGTTTASNQSWTSDGVYQQISGFSSYQVEGYGPTGEKLPWITAPGEVIIAGYNSGYSASNYYYAYGTNKVLGAMSGTSMATPCVAGIVALWKQANPALTVSQVKDVMQETAISDTYVTGTYASHFGQGKIDALAGLAKILAEPTILASPSSVTFTNAYATQTYTQTITVTGVNLTANIAVAKSGSSVFTVDKTSITQSGGNASATITVTYSPTAAGTQTGTLTLSSAGADNVTINLSGTAQAATPTIIADKSSLTFEATKGTAADAQTVNVSGVFLTGNVTVAVSGTGFAVNTTSISNSEVLGSNGKDITVTFTAPAATGNYTGTLTLTSAGAETVTINLTGTSNPKQTSKTVYKLVSSVSSGKKYLIVSTNAVGSGNALSSSSSNAISNNTVTIQSGDDGNGTTITYIEDPNTYSVWTSGTNGSSMTFAVNDYYLYHNSGALSMSTATSKNNWTVGNNATTLSYSGGGTKYLAYNSSWQISSSSSNVYFYEETTINIDEDDTPILSASQTSLSFSTSVGVSTQQTLTLTGVNLTGNVTVAVSGTGFSASPTTITAAQATAGQTVTVTYNPTAGGSHTGTLTFSSEDAENVVVSLSGTAIVPELSASVSSLSFSTMVGTSVQQTFTLTGSGLTGNVTATVSGDGFSVSPTTLTAAQAQAGQTMTVTYDPSARGSHTGTVTLSSAGATSVTVSLSGEAMPANYDVAVSTYGLATLNLDFPVTIPYDDYEDLLGVYYVKTIEDGELRLARLSRNIPANTGVIVQANSGTYRFPANTGTVTDLSYNNLMQGVSVNTPSSEILATASEGTFIYTLGMGVAGAALATTISKGISLIVLLLPFFRHKTVIELRFKYFTPNSLMPLARSIRPPPKRLTRIPRTPQACALITSVSGSSPTITVSAGSSPCSSSQSCRIIQPWFKG